MPLTGVRARIDGRTLPGIYGVPRPDVHAFFGDSVGAACSGYLIPVVARTASSTCAIEARLPNGRWEMVQSVVLEAAPGNAWSELLKWARFWIRAWLGWRQGWADTSAAERDFVVTRIRQRGWFNLDAVPQHAPHPLLCERLPVTPFPLERLPRLAVVTPSFQQAAFLEATITSVLNQEGVDIDYVVQDGGSTDGSADIIRRYADRLAHWESAPDGGQAAAIGRGFASVNLRPDDLMMYLNSDDILMPGSARFVAEYFARHPDVDVVYGHRVLIDGAGREVGRWMVPRQSCDDLRLFDFVPQETLFWRNRIWTRVGGIDVSFKFAMDWDLLLRFRDAGARIVRLPWFLAGFRLHSSQKSQTRMKEDGIPEMSVLRRRVLGRLPSEDELHTAARCAEVDSALVYALYKYGVRV